MAYFRSENNVFCDSIKVVLESGEATGIKPTKHFVAPISPFRLDTVSAVFSSAATGTVEVWANKHGEDLLVRSQDIEDATSLIVSGIGLWMEKGDSVKVVATGLQGTVIVDFTY